MKKLALISMLLLSLVVHAQEVNLASGDDYAPYADRNLPNGGMTTEIITKAFVKSNLTTKVTWLPWARGFNEAKEGKFDGTFPYLKTAEREVDFLYSDVVIKLESNIFVNPSNKKYNFADVASMSGSTACVPLGWAPPKKLEEMIKSGQIKKAEPKDGSTCVKMVSAGRADFFVTDETQGLAAIKSAGVTDGSVIKANVPPLADNSLYLIVGKKVANAQSMVAQFNKGLAVIKKSGEFDQIVKSHSK